MCIRDRLKATLRIRKTRRFSYHYGNIKVFYDEGIFEIKNGSLFRVTRIIGDNIRRIFMLKKTNNIDITIYPNGENEFNFSIIPGYVMREEE